MLQLIESSHYTVETSFNLLQIQDQALPSLFDEQGSLFLDNDFNQTTVSSSPLASPFQSLQRNILPRNLLHSPLNSVANHHHADQSTYHDEEASQGAIDILALSTCSYKDNRDSPHKLHAIRNRLVSIQAEHDSPPHCTLSKDTPSPSTPGSRFGGFGSAISEESGGSSARATSDDGKTGDVEGFLRDWQGDELRTRDMSVVFSFHRRQPLPDSHARLRSSHEVLPLALNGISLSPTIDLNVIPLVPSRPTPLSFSPSRPTPLTLPFPPSPPPSTLFSPLPPSIASPDKLANMRAFAANRLQKATSDSPARGGMEDEDFKVSPTKKSGYAALGVRSIGQVREPEEIRVSSNETIKASREEEFDAFDSLPPRAITPTIHSAAHEVKVDSAKVGEDLLMMWDDNSTEFQLETQSTLIAPLLPQFAATVPTLAPVASSLNSSANTLKESTSDRLRRKIEEMSLARSSGSTAASIPVPAAIIPASIAAQPTPLPVAEPEIVILAEKVPELELEDGDFSVIFGGRQEEGQVELDNFITPAPFKRPLISAALAALLTSPAPTLPPTTHAQTPTPPILPPTSTRPDQIAQNSFLSPLVGRQPLNNYEALGSERKETTRDRLDRAREERIRREAIRSPENIALRSSLLVDVTTLHSTTKPTTKSPVTARGATRETGSPSLERKSGSMRSSLAPALSRSGPRSSILPVPVATSTTNGLGGSRINRTSLAGKPTSPFAPRLSPTAHRYSLAPSASTTAGSALSKSAIPSIPRRPIVPPLSLSSTRLTASALSSNFSSAPSSSLLPPTSTSTTSRPALHKRTQSSTSAQLPTPLVAGNAHTRTSSASSLMSSDRENYAIPRVGIASTARGGGGISASSSSSTIVGIASGKERESGIGGRTALPSRGLVRPTAGVLKSTGMSGKNPLANGAGNGAIRPDSKLSQSSPSARRRSIAPSATSTTSFYPSAIPSPIKSTLVSPAKRTSISTTNPAGRLPLRSIQLPSSSSSSGISALAGGAGGRKGLGESNATGGEGKVMMSRSGAPLGVRRLGRQV